MTDEIWKPVVGHEGHYEVSDQGRVRSVYRAVRIGNHTRRYQSKLLAPGTMNRFGHQSVAIGKGNSRCVHDLVLEAFVGPRPPGQEGRHADLDGSNNRLDNLSWGSRGENNKDVTRAGRRKLTYEQADALRADRAAGMSLPSLAEKYGVNTGQAHHICAGKQYVR